MVKVLEISGKKIKDTRGEETIEVRILTNVGKLSASSPNGRSVGKFESKSYKGTIENDIKTLKKFSEYFIEENIENFDDLRRIEDITEGHLGANSTIALEYAVLKAIAKSKKCEVWQLVNSKAKKGMRLVGNCIGGGAHSKTLKKPDFQEFLLIPNKETIEENQKFNIKTKEKVRGELAKADKNFEGEKNDEKGWMVELNEKEILDILKEQNLDLGIDVAGSNFYSRKKYKYKNPRIERNSAEQMAYLENLLKNYPIFYLEDPFDQEDFESFAKLLEKFPKKLIVGDDLTVTNLKRLKKALMKKSINALIVKPNQVGSLIEVKRIIEECKKKDIKIIFSHRSGETAETIIADLAFGFEADFFKCGIIGDERVKKIERLIEIERSLKK